MFYTLKVFTSACYLPSFLVIFNFFKWYYAILMCMFVAFMLEKSGQQTIVVKKSRQACGSAVGIIFSLFSAYFVYVAKHLSPFWSITITVNVITIAFTLYKTATTKPTSLNPNDIDARERLAVRISAGGITDGPHPTAPNASQSDTDALLDKEKDDELPPVKLCTTCLVDKNFASTHCARCDICVTSLDHHCPFVNNCVARGNRRMFVFFCLSASIGCGLFTALSLWTQHHILCAEAREGVVQNIVAGLSNTSIK